MLYTSGSTGKPKGVLHTVGGYMVQVIRGRGRGLRLQGRARQACDTVLSGWFEQSLVVTCP